jgi:hypothetical protein
MITAFTGLPGGGKTLSAVYQILDYLKRGATIATNIELNRHKIRRYLTFSGFSYNPDRIIELTPEMLMNPQRFIPKGKKDNFNLLVLDELAIYLPCREYQKTSKEFYHYLILIRRQFTDCILITQKETQIDKQIRSLFQFRYNHVNLKRSLRFPILGFFPFELILRIQYDLHGNRYGIKFVTINKWKARCYNSLQEVEKFDGKDIKIQNKERKVNAVYLIYRFYRYRFRLFCNKIFFRGRTCEKST